jgi:hypothetical protein
MRPTADEPAMSPSARPQTSPPTSPAASPTCQRGIQLGICHQRSSRIGPWGAVLILREPAQPVGGVGALAGVGIGGDEDLIKQVDTQLVPIGQGARQQPSGIV